jgi:hypothetical protein
MPLIVLVDPEGKKKVGECPVDAMMRVSPGECGESQIPDSVKKGNSGAILGVN